MLHYVFSIKLRTEKNVQFLKICVDRHKPTINQINFFCISFNLSIVRVVSERSTFPSRLLAGRRTDTQASELPRRILSPANELVNVTRGGCDRCPL